MSGLDWAKDKRRQQQRELARESRFERARKASRARSDQEQRTYLEFARAHAAENRFCADVARQQRLSKAQAGVLRRIAADNGWPLQATTTRPSKSGQASGQCLDARRAVESYDGSNRWLHYVQREFLGDPNWLPPDRMAAKILAELSTEMQPPTESPDRLAEGVTAQDGAVTVPVIPAPGVQHGNRGETPGQSVRVGVQRVLRTPGPFDDPPIEDPERGGRR